MVGNPTLKQMTNKISLKIVNFDKELARVEREVREQSNMQLEERIDYATLTLRQVTPVDTGRARKGWEQEKYRDRNKFVGATIKNSVEYISVLNQGHSKQAPRYFIEQVLSKIGILTPN